MMKSLNPSLRIKRRYLFVKGENTVENIKKAILEFIGVLGMAKTKLDFIESGKNYAIIAIDRKMLNEVRASFCVFREKLSVERVSGTLKNLKKSTNKFKKRC